MMLGNTAHHLLFNQLRGCLTLTRTRPDLTGDELTDALAHAYAKVILPYTKTNSLVNLMLFDRGSISAYVDGTIGAALNVVKTRKDADIVALEKRRAMLYPLIPAVDWAFPRSSTVALLTRALHLRYLNFGRRTREFNNRLGFIDTVVGNPQTTDYVNRLLAGDHPQAGEKGPILFHLM